MRDKSAGSGNDLDPRAAWGIDGKWHHLAFTRSLEGNNFVLRIYGDGELLGTDTSTQGLLSNNTPVRLGSHDFNTFPPQIVDEVSIYSRALSAIEIRDAYLMGAP